MKKIFAILALSCLPVLALASGGAHLDRVGIDLDDKPSLQRGAKLFVNYCLSCHSAAYMRYNRMGADLGLSEDEVTANLMFAGDKVGETMTIAMRDKDAKNWFGTPAPDLSVVSRSRGADWLYTYLRSFYADPKRPFGVNNLVFPDVAMPHVLAELQGTKQAVWRDQDDASGGHKKVVDHLEPGIAGRMDAPEYDRAVRDLVNFMVYLGEPARMVRGSLGAKVILFLAFFWVVAYLLKKEYWKDVH